VARQKLADSPSARADTEILMASVLNATRSFLYANPELVLPYKRSESFKKLVKQRALGQPIAYLTGRSEFWSLTLKVTPSVLIPRPETELLIETALEKIPVMSDWRIVDLGTGSGAIALALASERKKCEVHATDTCPDAIAVAQDNARRLGLERIQFHLGSWSEPLHGKFQMVVSNPPYIEANDPHLLQGDCRFEPRVALTPGSDGLAAIRLISQSVKTQLVDGGWLIFEHGWDQGPATREILSQSGYQTVQTFQDLQGHERITIGENI